MLYRMHYVLGVSLCSLMPSAATSLVASVNSVKKHISYKMPYLIRPLQCRRLVSDDISQNAYLPVLRKMNN